MPFREHTFAGESLEYFRRWLCDLALWEHETDVVATKQGTKVFRNLSRPTSGMLRWHLAQDSGSAATSHGPFVDHLRVGVRKKGDAR